MEEELERVMNGARHLKAKENEARTHLDNLFKTLASMHKEIMNLKHEQDLADQEIRRKNDDLIREQENKDKLERQIDAIAQ